jgi:hypothetical protein
MVIPCDTSHNISGKEAIAPRVRRPKMNERTKESIRQTLEEYAMTKVPEDLKPWTRIRTLAQATVQTGQAQPQKMLPRNIIVASNRGAERNRHFAFGVLIAFAAALVVIVSALFLNSGTQPVSAEVLLQKAEDASALVPQGFVRHMVIDLTESSRVTGFEEQSYSYEVWLSNGQSHLLLRKKGPAQGRDLLVGEDAVWDYNPLRFPGIVRKSAYKPDDQQNFVPNYGLKAEMLQLPGTHAVENSKLDGRDVLVIERTNDAVPGSGVPEGDASGVVLEKVWLDSRTYRVVQHQHAIREVENGVFSDKVDTGSSKIVLDELLPISVIPPDLFTYHVPANITVQEALDPASTLP